MPLYDLRRQDSCQDRVSLVFRLFCRIRCHERASFQSSVQFGHATSLPRFELQLTPATVTDLCLEYGTLDEKQIGRDRTPDKSVNNLAVGIIGTL